ncbi:sigma-54-dependent Fis family transcriptional regulator [Myxococcus sp. CA056]|uniref:sigma-54-dependent transcriptional regulator n=1 Tax=unclassified Myxococcus TaxID=2648731 RepID=UPI00157AA733|nr:MULTISPECIES: sigma-54 dependent transcriptional regulator [unclassified Myxococcus]NTX12153.1 sigma-54-dependent Fis family transcriptional regulator [Myxococcus sp. CA056]NTX57223.1 sigma-54-dependent Fis family transcriptional regulator [Myxococcus sp. CA039A]
MPASVLIVDDEKNILLTLSQSLQLAGYQTHLAASGQVALDVVSARPVDAVLMDVKMPDMDGLTALARLTELKPELPVIMMSGHGTIDTAVKATQLGARDFLEKPIARERLLVALRNVLKHQAAMEELRELREQLGRYDMVGSGPAMQRIFSLIQRTAPSEGRVLITGENGTGKELIARALHQHSRRKANPFVKLNCAAVPHELIESELFGHEKGAFTGAVSVRRGKFELAHEGTLFLDEIGDMPPAMQAKLLRVLQEGELERVGGAETLKVDVRVIAATNKNLEKEISAGRFREDLYYRINVVQIHSPPLRERREDLPDLIGTFLREACAKNGRRPLTLSPDALSVMSAYDYPGNVRELRNLVERLAILCEGPIVTRTDALELLPRGRGGVPPPVVETSMAMTPPPPTLDSAVVAAASTPAPALVAPPPPLSAPVQAGFHPRADKTFREQVEDAEREIILYVLAHTHDNVTEAARLLDLERGHFYKKMKALGLRRGQSET